MRTKIVLGMVFAVCIALLVRVYYISIKSNAYYEEIAQQNAIKVDELAPLRGVILDRKLNPLSVNRLGFSIGITPRMSLKSKQEMLDEEISFLASLMPEYTKEGLTKAYLKADSSYNHDFVDVIDFVPYDKMIPHFAKIAQRENLKIKITSKRHYPHASLASHVIGYVGKSNTQDVLEDETAKLVGFSGKTGIEKYYNAILQGVKGEKKTKVTAFNQAIEEVSKTLPHSNDLVLSLDLELQRYVESSFEEASGAVIVMNAQNGEILAAASFPEYDLNTFVGGISQEEWSRLANDLKHPFTNKLVNGLYPPGSVIKMGVGMAILNTGIISPSTLIESTGVMELGGRLFRDWKKEGHGMVNYVRAIQRSCDDYFYKTSLKVGIDNIAPFLSKLGFGQKTGVDLPREFLGIVPSREWKKKRFGKGWAQGETLISSIGQGYFLVTPMQIAKYTAFLATGKGVTPHFLHKVNDVEIDFPVDSALVSEEEKRFLKVTQEGMYEVANAPGGTAVNHLKHTAPFKIAAKTGTAQVVGISQTDKKRMREEDMEYFHRSHAWLTTYAPHDNPQYVITVLVEHGGHGGSEGGPIAAKIYDKLYEMGYITIPEESKGKKK
ncbi:penicillin-binding protein 2 [Sulfurospirillum deleyianum]|uniref:Penicillin-binding protein 2 n=1 Tax=Sulfurospirillum deleyianum (strain ATCC 51133 / DSM 6946 / 5175) TaxID=525898 RepID=D1B089_SULD5|nr:penicillin-binding protein 2 [Sulfurospirillum deleyianum]ACZ11706.1 penicillin-binding protein 2 [Sulfurospirillum deleyianum DSM 6946]